MNRKDLDAFLAVAGVLPEPMLLVRVDGIIEGANRAFTAEFGWSARALDGRNLSALTGNPDDELVTYLRHCSATRALIPGSLTVRTAAGALLKAQCGGGLYRSSTAGEPSTVVLRLAQKTQGTARFVALTQKIDELTIEIARRRDAEAAAAASLLEQEALRDKLEILMDASGALFASLVMDDVLETIGGIAERLIRADVYALWKQDAATGAWRVAWQKNLSPAFVTASAAWTPGTAASIPAPLMVSDLNSAALLALRRSAYASEGIESLTIIPLRALGEMQATVAAYYRKPMRFGDSDRRLAVALGNLGSSALHSVLLNEAQGRSRAQAERAGQRATFLARAGSVLAGSLDYEATLRVVAELAVPEIADWCAVDVVNANGELKRLAVAHVDPAKVAFVSALRQEYPEDPDAPRGVQHVVRQREPVLVERIPDEMLVAAARDERHLLLIRELGLASYMCVPLVAHGRALGALTFASAESGRIYGPGDLAFAQDVAARAALAVENADAYAQVRRANQLKDEFLATLSHELRTPLNADPRLRPHAAGRRAAGGQAGRGAGDHRAQRQLAQPARRGRARRVAHRSAGKIASRRAAGGSLVRGDVGGRQRAAGRRRPRRAPRDDRRPRGACRLGDPDAAAAGRLEPPLERGQVHARRGGRVQVRARAGQFARGADRQRHRHRDRARVPAARLRALPPGRQLDAREHGGLGLGLAIVRHLVELHGGTVYVSSEGQGRGSTFRVLLPLVIVHSREAGSGPAGHPRGSPVEPAEPLADLSGLRVLVVDDDADALMLVREVLEAAGAEVLAVASGPEALEVLARHVPHALVSDVGMPGMDGFELISRIRALGDPALRSVPAAALTAYARSQDRIRALANGFQMHLAKPINPLELAAAVRALTRRAASAT